MGHIPYFWIRRARECFFEAVMFTFSVLLVISVVDVLDA